MKKVLAAIFSLMLALVIAFVGSGVNVYFYCCDDCRSEGTAAVAEHRCCEVHQHDFENLAGCKVASGHHDCCSVERVSLDTNISSTQINLAPIILFVDNFFFVPKTEEIAPDPYLTVFKYSDTQRPPNISEEVYFSQLSVLII